MIEFIKIFWRYVIYAGQNKGDFIGKDDEIAIWLD